jgi:hypothetical protein
MTRKPMYSPHHLTFTQPRALGRRVSDEFTVPGLPGPLPRAKNASSAMPVDL